eukprot:3798005-Alexandrium_andersonii.AAC.1
MADSPLGQERAPFAGAHWTPLRTVIKLVPCYGARLRGGARSRGGHADLTPVAPERVEHTEAG